MLRMFQNKHVDGAKSYYSTADYYSEGQELTGQWRGKAAERLGLEGMVKQSDWDALCDNRHPETGDRLTARQKSDRTVGYDLNFHVPKSVSLLYALTRDDRILDAFRDAVDGTMQDIEAEMQTRVRKEGKNENRKTGNLAWGEFIHFTSRPVDGLPDPHLHAHCFVFNTTWDAKEQAWKAGQFREVNRDMPYFEAVFHSRLSYRLAEMGLPIERTKNGWELHGVDRELIDKFSRRTAEIERKAREKRIEDPQAKDALGAKTRQAKQKGVPFHELQAAWRERLTPQESDTLAVLEDRLGGDPEPADDNAAGRSVEHAIGHVFERKSVVPERTLLATALKHGVGRATVEDIHHEANARQLIVGERHGRRMVTTREVLGEEKQLIDFARQGRGTCRPFVKAYDQFDRDWLSDEQKRAVKHVVESRDRVMLLRGAAGVGKTSLMQETVDAIQDSGTTVVALAPSASASRGVMRAAGFDDADTVARFLLDEKLQQKAAGQLLWIDEAGQLGTKTMAHVLNVADRIDARVLFSGDRRQHGSVERGAALRILEEEAGIRPAEVKEIQRQADAYKEAVKALSEGRTAAGFKRLDDLGWVKEIPDDQREQQLVADYMETIGQGKSALVVSPTHAEGERITAEIRQAMRAEGILRGEEREFRVLTNANLTEAERGDAVNYHAGDELVFHQNAKGFTRGDRLSVNGSRPLPLDQAARFQVFHSSTLHLSPGDLVRITKNGRTVDDKHAINNGSVYHVRRFDDDGNLVLDNGWLVGKDFGHLAHGYVVTSHAAQGRTVDHHVFIGQSSQSFPASSREQFYVSASRAKERVTIYTDDKEALREAIEQSDERLSATEFVNGRWRADGTLREPPRALDVDRSGREKEDVSLER